MYVVYNKDYVHHLMNVSKILIFAYNTDRRMYISIIVWGHSKSTRVGMSFLYFVFNSLTFVIVLYYHTFLWQVSNFPKFCRPLFLWLFRGIIVVDYLQNYSHRPQITILFFIFFHVIYILLNNLHMNSFISIWAFSVQIYDPSLIFHMNFRFDAWKCICKKTKRGKMMWKKDKWWNRYLKLSQGRNV